MGYLAASVIAAVAVLSLLAFVYVQHELRPAARASPVFARAGMRRTRRAAAGDNCVCGGTVGRTGRTSARFGDLLGCTGCRRLWTADGRRIIRRRRYPPQDQPPADSASLLARRRAARQLP